MRFVIAVLWLAAFAASGYAHIEVVGPAKDLRVMVEATARAIETTSCTARS